MRRGRSSPEIWEDNDRLRRRPSPAIVIALIALVASFAGTAAARVLISSPSQIRTGVVNGRHLRDRSVTARDLVPGAGLTIRYVATSFTNPAHQQTGGHAQCPKGYYALGGGVSGFATAPGQQSINVARPFDSRQDTDRIPDQYQGFVDNLTATDGTFEVVVVCVRASSVSSNYLSSDALRAGVAPTRPKPAGAEPVWEDALATPGGHGVLRRWPAVPGLGRRARRAPHARP